MVQAARIFFDGNGVLLEFNIPRVVHAIGGDAENEKQRDGAAEDMTPPVHKVVDGKHLENPSEKKGDKVPNYNHQQRIGRSAELAGRKVTIAMAAASRE